MRKPAFCICENKDADQLRGNREADQRLCFRYIDSTIPLLSKYEISSISHLLWLYSPVCVGPGRKPRRPVFAQRGSFILVFTRCIISKKNNNSATKKKNSPAGKATFAVREKSTHVQRNSSNNPRIPVRLSIIPMFSILAEP